MLMTRLKISARILDLSVFFEGRLCGRQAGEIHLKAALLLSFHQNT